MILSAAGESVGMTSRDPQTGQAQYFDDTRQTE
jgi:hypothetical protein